MKNEEKLEQKANIEKTLNEKTLNEKLVEKRLSADELKSFLFDTVEEEQEDYTDWRSYDVAMVASSFDIKDDGSLQLISLAEDKEKGLVKNTIRIRKERPFEDAFAKSLMGKKLEFVEASRIEIQEKDEYGDYSGDFSYVYVAKDVKAVGNAEGGDLFHCNVFVEAEITKALPLKRKELKTKAGKLKKDNRPANVKFQIVLESGTRKDLFEVVAIEVKGLSGYVGQFIGRKIRINDLEKTASGIYTTRTAPTP